MKNWLDEIKKEREKQIFKNGYTHSHDDEHTDGSIADAAAHYASSTKSDLYPWDQKFNSKEKNTRERQLIIAGSLNLAELERIAREKENN